MRQNIYINEASKARNGDKRKISLKSISLIFLILLPIALYIVEGSNFTSALKYIFSKKDIVIFDTYTIVFEGTVPSEYVDIISTNLEELDFNGKKRFKIVKGNADIRLSFEEKEDTSSLSIAQLVPVGHIYSLVNKIDEDTLSNYSIYVLNDRYVSLLENQYDISLSVLPSYDDLIEKLEESDKNIALVGFESVDYRVKVLEFNEKYYLEDISGCVQLEIFVKKDSKVKDFIIDVLGKNIAGENEALDVSSLVKVNMGGVVAMSRALAAKIDNSGDYKYPARDLGNFLSDADLTHVSNEASFVPGCSVYSGMRFCSRPEYIETLTFSGVDIVELTGNHNNDYGAEYNTDTIEKYKELGMRYFGGGLDSEDASKILYEEVDGFKLAFVGYNYYDTIYQSSALAGEERAGANSYSVSKLESDINEAKENADIVIVTFQFQECYSYPASDVIYPICYKPLSVPDQRVVFREAIDLGANIVVGTQAHQPQTYELYGDGVIFYGLGNLFFDQSIWIGTRQGIILSHYFYNGKHIQTKLNPTYMESDLIPRLATEEEGDLLLRLLKEARN